MINFESARNTIVSLMQQVGFKVVGIEPHCQNEFEVWVEYAKNGNKGKEALYFDMRVEEGHVCLYWCDFTHQTLVAYLDGTRNNVKQGLQSLYCGELDPPIAA